jgi:formylglycine-generating enzyme required for sulfatase activity
MILFGAASLLLLARDGFNFFLHDAFSWLLVLKDAIVGVVLEQPLVAHAVERIVVRMDAWLGAMGFSTDLVLQSHWKHAFVLLSLGFAGYAHMLRDFARRPATSTFRYVNALVCALLGGLMVGTDHLSHPGVVAWPLAAFLLFLGLNSIWRCAFEREAGVRIAAGQRGVLWLGAAGLIVLAGLSLGHASDFTDENSTVALMIIACVAAGIGVWATVFGFAGLQTNSPAGRLERRARPRWLDNPGRRLGMRVLATLGLAAVLAAFGQLAWGMARAANATEAASHGAGFRECPQCPDMLTIPAGNFTMGTTRPQVEQLQASQSWNDKLYGDELPARKLAVSAFALSRTEVTIAEFQAFLAATGYRPGGMCWGLHNGHLDFHRHNSWRDPGYAQDPDHPVVCVNWRDAQAYVRWLSLNTGEIYRLPTEAEWEYAARAGTQTNYFWGDEADAGCAFNNGADEQARLEFPQWQTLACDDGAPFTAAVASYAPNAFGLYDMTGNVWEWVEDCYERHAPAHTGDPAHIPACSHRVIRGGGWNYGAIALRTANRDPHHPATRGAALGFRVARTLLAPAQPRVTSQLPPHAKKADAGSDIRP